MPSSSTSAKAPTAPGRPLVARGIEKSFRHGWWPRRRPLQVLRGADVDLRAGEVVGLVGENGSGKSTLMKILVGALPADDGTVIRTGRIGYCPQVAQVYGRLTCDDHVELFGAAYGLSPRQARASARGLYEALGRLTVVTSLVWRRSSAGARTPRTRGSRATAAAARA